MTPIPEAVQRAAQQAIDLKKLGFKGGTPTGHKRAKQLARGGDISSKDLKVMRAWYARHLYASYPSYLFWVKEGKKKSQEYIKYGGIYSWLAWGGDPGYKWVNSSKVTKLLD